MMMSSLSMYVKSRKEISTLLKGVAKILVFEHHISTIPFIVDGSKLYGPVTNAMALRLLACLSISGDL